MATAESRQVQLVEAAACHAETAGQAAALRDWHADLIERAQRAGYAGLAATCDGATLREIVPDPAQRLAHERDLTELARKSARSVTLLCRYDVRSEPPGELADLAGLHVPGLLDVCFSAARAQDRLIVTGEIDASNAARFGAVLSAAVDTGIRLVDVGGVEFLAAAGLRALIEASRPVGERGETVTLQRVRPTVRRVLDLSGLSEADAVTIAP
jgi:anti-anti-sigma factor